MLKLTETDAARIAKMYRDGKLSTRQIAEIYDINQSTVRDALAKTGVPLRNHTCSKAAGRTMREARQEAAKRRAQMTPLIVKWYGEGLGCHVIKQMLRGAGFTVGTDHTAIVKMLHAAGVKVRPQGAGGTRSRIPLYIEDGVFCA